VLYPRRRSVKSLGNDICRESRGFAGACRENGGEWGYGAGARASSERPRDMHLPHVALMSYFRCPRCWCQPSRTPRSNCLLRLNSRAIVQSRLCSTATGNISFACRRGWSMNTLRKLWNHRDASNVLWNGKDFFAACSDRHHPLEDTNGSKSRWQRKAII
jgi:hypothetical protein